MAERRDFTRFVHMEQSRHLAWNLCQISVATRATPPSHIHPTPHPPTIYIRIESIWFGFPRRRVYWLNICIWPSHHLPSGLSLISRAGCTILQRTRQTLAQPGQQPNARRQRDKQSEGDNPGEKGKGKMGKEYGAGILDRQNGEVSVGRHSSLWFPKSPSRSQAPLTPGKPSHSTNKMLQLLLVVLLGGSSSTSFAWRDRGNGGLKTGPTVRGRIGVLRDASSLFRCADAARTK